MRKSYSNKFFRKIDNNKDFFWSWTPSNDKSGGILSGIRKDRLDVEDFENGDFLLLLMSLIRNSKSTGPW